MPVCAIASTKSAGTSDGEADALVVGAGVGAGGLVEVAVVVAAARSWPDPVVSSGRFHERTTSTAATARTTTPMAVRSTRLRRSPGDGGWACRCREGDGPGSAMSVILLTTC